VKTLIRPVVVCIALAHLPALAEDSSVMSSWPPRGRAICEHLLPSADQAFSSDDAQAFVREKGTRGATYLAVGMLCRDGLADRDNAAAVIREILTHQWNDPGQRRHGVWPRSPGSELLDENWREFVGVGLILVLRHFEDRLPDDLVESIDTALSRAAEGAYRRNVSPNYTNIALMSAFLLDYVGWRHDNLSMRERGEEKAEAIFEAFEWHKTFQEYNSPTYYGVDLLGLALWRSEAPSERLRERGAAMEADLWRDIAQFYHADLRNLAGPCWRSYGMDMTHYVALTGLLIALAVDENDPLPLPSIGAGGKQFELNYTPLYCLLQPKVPAEAMIHLRKFQEPRALRRTVSGKSGDHDVRVVIEPTWMMGATTGLHRRWEQHYPATLHWLAEDGDQASGRPIGWLLILGENGVDAKIDGRKLRVFMPKPDADEPLRLRICTPGLTPAMLTGDTWNLAGMKLRVTSPLKRGDVVRVGTSGGSPILEVRRSVPETLTPGTLVLDIEVL